MLRLIFSIKNISFVFIAAIFFMVSTSSCGNKNYPCPAYGDSNAADLSMFDEEGDLKGKKGKRKVKGGRIDKSTGLVNKKSPKKIRKKRKKRL